MMGPLATNLEPFFDWLLRTTWQAGVLVCLILLLQRIAGRRLGVRGRYCLWLVLLVRLALPWAPHSPVSMYNLLPQPLTEVSGARPVPRLGPRDSSAVARDEPVAGRVRAGPGAGGATETVGAGHLRPFRGRGLDARAANLLALLWLGGAGAFAGYITVVHVRVWRMLRRAKPVTDRNILDLLDDCKRLIGTRANVRALATDAIGSPALFGWRRPRLLLPGAILTGADLTGLRHIFLHELAHLKRHDILVGHIAGLLHVMHWFNPLIGLAFRRMRADRELVCDALALSLLGPDETRAYGRTVVRQLERLRAARWNPILAAISGDKSRIKQRVAMISAFRKKAYGWSPLAGLLVALVACTGLTDGHVVGEGSRAAVRPPETARLDADDPVESTEPAAVLVAHEGGHANIIRVHIRHRETGKYLAIDGDRVTCDADEPEEAGTWEARFNGNLGHGDEPVSLYSLAAGLYLTTDTQGNLAVDQLIPDEGARWIVQARPEGVWIVSDDFQDQYLRLNEEAQVKAEEWGRDVRSYWDVVQLEKIK
jgi:bla regulator protein BlaR1